MNDREIEKRIAVLEAEVASLKGKIEKKTTKTKFPGGNNILEFSQMIPRMRKR